MNKQPLYLVMVTAGENNNKYYRMIPDGDNFIVQYGRIGNSYVATDTYPISMWDKKLNEKLRKGYIDQTRLVIAPVTRKNKEYADIPIAIIAKLVARLQAFAQQAIAENYTITANKVTQAMVDEAQDLINRLNLADRNPRIFNAILLDLFKTIPRKMGKVADYLVDSGNDFRLALQREQDLLDVMRGQVVQQEIGVDVADTTEEAKQTILEALGLKIHEIKKEDENTIKSLLGELEQKFSTAWLVVNNKTQKNFDAFVLNNGITNKQLFWHGSRNENWWSIINSGLILRPNARITGKMFGDGIYFAPSAKKSFGYTSYSGSYWARGTAGLGIMGLFDVAYGTPYHVYNRDNFQGFDYKRLQQIKAGANSLHAHAGQMLHNDEIVIYKENQITIKYLVELT